MEKTTKDFDCVEMKRRGAENVHRETCAMTPEEELAYWQRGTEELRSQQGSLRINGGRKQTDLHADPALAEA